jgi:formate dehydrogenase alpha subunit
VAGLAASFGSGAVTNSIADIEKSKCIFIIGSNTTEAHPLVAYRIMKARKNGASLIVADPRKIHISTFSDVHVRQRLGTDVALINGIMHVIIKEGWEDREFIANRTEGFDALSAMVERFAPKKAEEITGVSAENIRTIAELYAKSGVSAIIYAMGITQHTTGVDNVKSLANLAMLCGHIGKEGGGVNPLRGQNNVQGACDMGGLPNVYPGYQRVDDENAAKKFEQAWNATLSRKPGLTITDMFPAIEEGRVRALYVMAENPMLSDPDIRHVERALGSLELLIVQDIFMTETARLADIVLPGVTFAEKDGIFTNTERRAQRIRKAVDPIGDSVPDWEIIRDVSNKMGYPMHYKHPFEIQEEISRLTPSYGGITYDRLEGDGLQWPCPDKSHPGTAYLHKDKFSRGLGLFSAIDYAPPAELPDDEYPMALSTGRMYFHYHTGTLSRKSPSLNLETESGYAEISRADAQRLGIRDGEKVKVVSRRGEIETTAVVTDMVKSGFIFIPFHFFEGAANVLTNTAFDPVAKIPELKVCAVRVAKAS